MRQGGCLNQLNYSTLWEKVALEGRGCQTHFFCQIRLTKEQKHSQERSGKAMGTALAAVNSDR